MLHLWSWVWGKAKEKGATESMPGPERKEYTFVFQVVLSTAPAKPQTEYPEFRIKIWALSKKEAEKELEKYVSKNITMKIVRDETGKPAAKAKSATDEIFAEADKTFRSMGRHFDTIHELFKKL